MSKYFNFTADYNDQSGCFHISGPAGNGLVSSSEDMHLQAQLTRKERDIFNASFDRCLETCESDIHFINFFYSNLRSSSSEVAGILDEFPLNHRIYALRHSIYILIEFSEQRRSAVDLIRVACMEYQPVIKPFMLDLWLRNLLLAVAEYDRENSPQLQEIWRKAMAPGIALAKNYLAVENTEDEHFQHITY